MIERKPPSTSTKKRTRTSGGFSSTRSGGATVRWVMLIYFLSGACSLMDEVVWVRLLKFTLGNTVYATSIVVSVFMGGLALGALIMGRFSDGVKNRLRLYAILETLVTLSVLALPFVLKLADRIYIGAFRSFDAAPGQLLALQVLISAAVLLVPTMLMGSTLPLLGRFVTSLERETGHMVGRLYALNMLGAAAGCLLAGFVLVGSLGVMGTVYVASGINLIVALGGWHLSRRTGPWEEEKRLETARGETVATSPGGGRGSTLVLFLALFLSGAISIGYELLWMRSITHLLGGFTYVFSAVLTVYLLGNVIGVGIGSRLAARLRRPAVGYAAALSVLGFCGIFYLPLLGRWTTGVPDWMQYSYTREYSWLAVSPALVEPLLHSLLLFLLPSLVMGLGFPLALQAWANRVHRVGLSTGTAYGVNTVGAVFGGLLTGFVLIPSWGVQASLSILGGAGLWTAAVLWFVSVGEMEVFRRWVGAAVAAALTVILFMVPPSLFETVVGRAPSIPEDYTLVAVEEGVTTTVSVHRDESDDLLLYVAGQSQAGESDELRVNQKFMGHLGILLHGAARTVLSVGFVF
jgi:spermidine synthase